MKTFLVGITQPDMDGIVAYLRHTEQFDFINTWAASDVPDQLKLVSMFAKLCYKSLVLGKNENVSRIRDIDDNIISVIESGHGSVFEHVWLNFISTGVSRVFTHELVRHRVGTAFSQTSGRYVSIDQIRLVLPPELSSVCWKCKANAPAVYNCDVCNGWGDTGRAINDIVDRTVDVCAVLRRMLIKPDMNFADKKRLTSAIRRLAPNGQDNEIAWSCNIRALRHMIEMRTSIHAEWEIRHVFNEVADIVYGRWPLMLYGGIKNEQGEWKGLRI